MRCHACGSEFRLDAGTSLGFREECERCRADLHVCLNCAHHDASAYNECRESNAERVQDRDRANRCEYFRPGPAEGPGASAGGESRNRALGDLERLFEKD